jgi:hypothetical protein
VVGIGIQCGFLAPGAPATHTKSRFRPSPGPSCVGGCVQRPVFAGFSAIFSVCALAQLYLKTLCVFFLSPLPRGVRGGSGLFVYQGNLLFWAESGPSGKARESLFEVWPRAGRPRNVFWESGPGPAATEPGFCQNGAAASAPRENKVFILMRSLAYMGLFGLYIYISFSYRTQAGRARISLGSRIDPGSGQNEKNDFRPDPGSIRLPPAPSI